MLTKRTNFSGKTGATSTLGPLFFPICAFAGLPNDKIRLYGFFSISKVCHKGFDAVSTTDRENVQKNIDTFKINALSKKTHVNCVSFDPSFLHGALFLCIYSKIIAIVKNRVFAFVKRNFGNCVNDGGDGASEIYSLENGGVAGGFAGFMAGFLGGWGKCVKKGAIWNL